MDCICIQRLDDPFFFNCVHRIWKIRSTIVIRRQPNLFACQMKYFFTSTGNDWDLFRSSKNLWYLNKWMNVQSSTYSKRFSLSFQTQLSESFNVHVTDEIIKNERWLSLLSIGQIISIARLIFCFWNRWYIVHWDKSSSLKERQSRLVWSINRLIDTEELRFFLRFM